MGPSLPPDLIFLAMVAFESPSSVAILDKFDAPVNDLSSGLPAEIKARRQQYAYYRDPRRCFREAA
jgi:type I restriction enzyme S subunit